MIKSGIIISFQEQTAVVRVPITAQNCASCSSLGACRSDKKDQCLEIPLSADQVLHIGDLVEVDVALPDQAVVSLIVFGIPLLGALAGGFLGYFQEPENDLIVFGGGMLGLLVGFIPAAIVDRKVKKLHPRARLKRIVRKSSEMD